MNSPLSKENNSTQEQQDPASSNDNSQAQATNYQRWIQPESHLDQVLSTRAAGSTIDLLVGEDQGREKIKAFSLLHQVNSNRLNYFERSNNQSIPDQLALKTDILGALLPESPIDHFLGRVGVSGVRMEWGLDPQNGQLGKMQFLGANNGANHTLGLSENGILTWNVENSHSLREFSSWLTDGKSEIDQIGLTYNGEQFALAPRLSLGNDWFKIGVKPYAVMPISGLNLEESRYIFNGKQGNSVIWDNAKDLVTGESLFNIDFRLASGERFSFYGNTAAEGGGVLGISGNRITNNWDTLFGAEFSNNAISGVKDFRFSLTGTGIIGEFKVSPTIGINNTRIENENDWQGFLRIEITPKGNR